MILREEILCHQIILKETDMHLVKLAVAGLVELMLEPFRFFSGSFSRYLLLTTIAVFPFCDCACLWLLLPLLQVRPCQSTSFCFSLKRYFFPPAGVCDVVRLNCLVLLLPKESKVAGCNDDCTFIVSFIPRPFSSLWAPLPAYQHVDSPCTFCTTYLVW